MIIFGIVVLAGAVIGSFLNVCIHRIPRDESIVFPASRCPSCSVPIRAYDNIPVLSYVVLSGKCRSCGARIPLRYPVVELLNALLYAAVVWRFGWGWSSVVYCLFCSALIVITFIDIDFQIIPDRITIPGIPIGLLAGSTFLPDPFLRISPLGFRASLIGAAAGFCLYYLIAEISLRLLRKEGMGGGDIKLMAMVGAFLGWKAVLLTTFLGSLAGSVAGIALIIRSGRERGTLIPFGPFLALGSLVSLYFGQEVLRWYLF